MSIITVEACYYKTENEIIYTFIRAENQQNHSEYSSRSKAEIRFHQK